MKADVGILLPRLEPVNYERFRVRYGGLAQELGQRSVAAFFAESHASFQPEINAFVAPFDGMKMTLASTGSAPVVRDLTMALDSKPLYESSIDVVHTPEFNRFIADKRNLFQRIPDAHPATMSVHSSHLEQAADGIAADRFILKPTTGHLSRGISILSRGELATADLPSGEYLAQELLDTSIGVPELGVEGVHNIRVLSIARQAIGAIVREGGTNAAMLQGDHYGNVFEIDQLPGDMRSIVDKVHETLADVDGSSDGVVAIDLMRGVTAENEAVDVLCEVNRRPQRISPYDLRDAANTDPVGIKWLAQQWDEHEAGMLARKAARHATIES